MRHSSRDLLSGCVDNFCAHLRHAVDNPGQADLSAAIIRISLGFTILFGVLPNAVPADYAVFIDAHKGFDYAPWGILRLLGNTPPSPLLLHGLAMTAGVAAFMMMVGLFSRWSAAVTLVTVLMVAAMKYAFRGYSHDFNVICLCLIAFQLVDGGRALSIDSALKPKTNRSTRSNQFGIWLSLAAVALMFPCAALWKIRSDPMLTWVLSDNLRNHLIVNYPGVGLVWPDWLLWVVEREWGYRSLAFGNMIGQTLPLLAVIFFRRPWIRLLGGIGFVAEVLGLHFVMGIFDAIWLPLFAVFVNWEYFVRRLRGLPWVGSFKLRPQGYVSAAFGLIFLTTFLSGALGFWNPNDVGTYPFSRFAMHSYIMAPRGQHVEFQFDRAHFRLTGEQFTPEEKRVVNALLLSEFFAVQPNATPENGKKILVAAAKQLKHQLPPRILSGRRVGLLHERDWHGVSRDQLAQKLKTESLDLELLIRFYEQAPYPAPIALTITKERFVAAINQEPDIGGTLQSADTEQYHP